MLADRIRMSGLPIVYLYKNGIQYHPLNHTSQLVSGNDPTFTFGSNDITITAPTYLGESGKNDQIAFLGSKILFPFHLYKKLCVEITKLSSTFRNVGYGRGFNFGITTNYGSTMNANWVAAMEIITPISQPTVYKLDISMATESCYPITKLCGGLVTITKIWVE